MPVAMGAALAALVVHIVAYILAPEIFNYTLKPTDQYTDTVKDETKRVYFKVKKEAPEPPDTEIEEEKPKEKELAAEDLEPMDVDLLDTELTELEMELGGAAFSVVYAEGFAVESNIASLNVSASRGKLRVKEKITFGRTDGGAKIILYVPENFVFATAEIETGAGDFNLSSFSAKQLSLSLGAGKVVIGELTVTGEAEIDGGAGAFTINGGSIRSLDFDMGVGDAQIRTELLGQCELNFGIGKASITLLGGAENYKLDIEKGIGRVTVGGEEQHGSTVYGIGNTLVDIECGIGEVNVSFE